MIEKWKKTVYEYMHNRNKLEVDYQVNPLLSTVRDDRYLRRQEIRLRRLQASHLGRQAKPLRNETGLVIRHVNEQENAYHISVDIEMRRSFDYELHGIKHNEERKERERLIVSQTNGRWHVTTVEPVVAERISGLAPSSEAIIRAEEESLDHQAYHNRTVPYLNPLIMNGYGFEGSYRPIPYNRRKVQEYANTWWNGSNPDYIDFEVDCTSFVSQCLFAGGAPMNYTGKRETGWWYQGLSQKRELWSFSWAVAHSLCMHLSTSKTGLRAEIKNSAAQLTIGDVICYDWDGNGRFQHNTIVAAMDAAGMPLVNAHTVNSKHRYWDYKDSYAWTPNTRYRFLHILDQF